MEFWAQYGEAAKTAAGFFWKAGWAFVLGYAISAIIQTFLPKGRLTKHMGDPDAHSISLATVFGSISSSCSFAALASARALIAKGAHFVAGVAFMFASTNLVIELGILILIFLGWQFLAAEIVGGVMMIAISSLLIILTYPESWIEQAREKVESETDLAEDFNPWEKLRDPEAWLMVGHRFVDEWKMVWEDILIGFTIAGFIAVFVPESFWESLFLADQVSAAGEASFLVNLENALVAPFVAAATFIGSMGNIPLATVLNASGVMFAGIMGFIYSDLIVPTLVDVNARYYGWRVALYIAGIMYISIVVTALALHYGFAAFGWTPESARAVEDLAQFNIDYTFWLNIFFVVLAGILIWAAQVCPQREPTEIDAPGLRQIVALVFLLILIGGGIAFFIIGGA